MPLPERALLALQGPQAVDALARLDAGRRRADLHDRRRVRAGRRRLLRHALGLHRRRRLRDLGAGRRRPSRWPRALLAQPEVKPAGLGARDTLRLEAGLCLYGHDIDETTTPVEAGLTWAIQKVRRPGGARAGGYPGADVIDGQLASGAPSKRVGLVGLERVPVREGAPLVDAPRPQARRTSPAARSAPTVNQPIAMAYLPTDHALPQHEVYAEVRGKRLPMRVTPDALRARTAITAADNRSTSPPRPRSTDR